ncbi:MAG: cob(I)yrinic acid a,c-diamide adenosyltransferase [Planctomycetes bacterium]|nr:cob(I)yrinic acid a,c-diamide adenosyltransferase [Planctomycetota bacterium]
MKIYTKTGDGGETGLFGGRRVRKDDPRVGAYGEVDELNSALGLAASLLADDALNGEIREIQRDLLTLGADLATPPDASPGAAARAVRIAPERSARLEGQIDRYEAENVPLTRFILPGGSPGAAALQLCRTVCRRAERAVVSLSASEEVNPAAVVYLNRLSDFLFVLARFVNRRAGIEEPRW